MFYILNGPNLNILQKRSSTLYGGVSLENIKKKCIDYALSLGVSIDFRQTNHEGELIEWVQESEIHSQGLIINAAAYTHTSIALHDALETLTIPIIEVHLSNIYKRENFRHYSYVHPHAAGIIMGMGDKSYLLALDALVSF
jgi:3-dehydroquinate dehydratase-2